MQTSRADLHCHSTASQLAKLGVQRALGLPECATPPGEVYELAKRRGMDFVTITDHDTIAGALEIADRSDVFVSEELTAWFKDEPQAVHVLCWDITPDDHDWLQRHARDVEACADYLHGNSITCALAHPFFAVAAPLAPRHRRVLAGLFPIWETRNGSRAAELNLPASIYIETHSGGGIGGSDDHAGVDVGRTYTETPRAATPQEFLASVRAGQATAHGDQGSAAKWAHSALALAARVVGCEQGSPDPRMVLELAERIVRDGDVRGGAIGSGLCPADARRLLRAWLECVELDLRVDELIPWMQSDEFSHAGLHRHARRTHERKLRQAADRAVTAAPDELAAAAIGVFEACTPVIPYAPSSAFLAREKAKLVAREGEPVRIALVADGVGGMHGVTHTLEEIRSRTVPGFEVEVIGTDPNVDRRLPSVADIEIPYYRGLKVGVPSLSSVVDALAEGRYGLVHLCSPGPAGVAAALVARVMGVPTLGSYHTELEAYARLRSEDERIESATRGGLSLFYGSCETVLSPSEAADRSLADLGVPLERIGRWERGVDVRRFNPGRRRPGMLGDGVTVLYAGRLTKEKGADLLADAFRRARERDPRIRLALAGGGPEEPMLRKRLGSAATFLGWLDGDDLAAAYASADVFLFASRTDTFGQVILEAQASGLPVVAVDEGGPAGLIEDSVTGRLCPPDADALAEALLDLVASPEQRRRIALAALAAVGARTWERSMHQLADGYARTLGATERARERYAA